MGLRDLFKWEPEPLPAKTIAIGVRYYEQWLTEAAAEGDTDAAVAADRWRALGAVGRDAYLHAWRLTLGPAESVFALARESEKPSSVGLNWALMLWGGWDSNPRPRDYESPALTG